MESFWKVFQKGDQIKRKVAKHAQAWAGRKHFVGHQPNYISQQAYDID